jgi:hypothetical protein
MRQETLAETLRELAERRDAKRQAEEAYLNVAARVPEDLRHWLAQSEYLRGYDDRQPEIDALQAELAAARQEFAEWLGASRKALDTHAALQERVRELESTILDEHSRLAQEEAKPAAVGVVGTVLGYTLADDMCVVSVMSPTREHADARLARSCAYRRVVAIVDPDAIVPLASGEPMGLINPKTGTLHGADHLNLTRFSDCARVYPGLAQPAQERDA